MLASKLLQTESLPLAKASTDLEPSVSQSFPKLRVYHRPKASSGKSTPPDERLSQEGYQPGFQRGFQAGSQAGTQQALKWALSNSVQYWYSSEDC